MSWSHFINAQSRNKENHKLTTWRPTLSLAAIEFRSQVLRSTRDFFANRGFLEVQTPCLSHESVIDLYLDPITVPIRAETCFLQTSPEAAMKRLVAAGAQCIYQIGPVFRHDEAGRYHNLEFTMLEWYRCGDSMAEGIALLCELFTTITGIPQVHQITYRSLFQKKLGIDPLDIAISDLAQVVETSDCGYQTNGSEDRDTMLDIIMGLIIQPQLQGPIVVSNYPITQAALARRSETDTETAERFELFFNGIELANGYAELSDGDELRGRAEETNRQRAAQGKTALPVPERLIAAMQAGLPVCSGTAVGFDRLVMVAGGFEAVEDVIPFPFPIA